MDALKVIKEQKILPVVVINKIEDTLPVLSSLREGGLSLAEITFRTACAADAIRLSSKEFKDMLIGAGTIINARQCEEAVLAGARFIVGPGYSHGVAEVCKKSNVPYFPGCVTPTEIMQALSDGIETVKFFPAQVYGGLKAIDALGAAFPAVKFIPTGGVDSSNLAEYLQNPKVFAIGGSWMLKGGDIAAKTAEAVKIVKNLG